MKTAFGILGRDLKLLIRNPIAFLVVGALLVLPGLYAWYCIYANWDPYSNTERFPIAVVNEDRGTTSDLTGEVNVGGMVADQLKENHKLDWQFPKSKEEALEDTRLGIYYATIVFPETLSEDIVGIFSGSSAEPTIYYYPNQKLSAVATKVSDSAVLTLTRQVNQAFASKVNLTILGKVQDGVDGAEASAAQMKGSAQQELAKVQEDIQNILHGLDEAQESIAGWRAAAAGGQDSLQGVSEQLPVIRQSLDQAGVDLTSLQEKTAEFDGKFSAALLEANTVLASTSARISARVAGASATAKELAGGIRATIQELRTYREVVVDLAEAIGKIDANLGKRLLALVDEIDSVLVTLEDACDSISSAADRASAKAVELNDNVQQATESATEASKTFSSEILPKLASCSNGLSGAAGGLSGAIGQFEPQIDELQVILARTDDALARADASIVQAKGLLGNVSANLQSTATDLGAMSSALQVDKLNELLNVSPDKAGSFLSSPVNMVTEKIYPVSNYGTAVAPFYTNLALWVGCFILISLIHLEVDRRGFERATSAERYFGRWLLLVILALLQSQVICGVDILLGIDCANPAWFMASGAICSFCYMNLIFALAISFRNIGKTLCILLLIMQVPGSSGMYPIEMMPGFFQLIHPSLPFTYGIDAMRESLCGMFGMTIVNDWLVLLTLVPASLLLGLVIRPRLMNLTHLFDTEMGKVGFFAAEEHSQRHENERMRNVMRTLIHSDMHRDEIEERAFKFRRSYPKLRRAGSIILFVAPFAFLFLMLPINMNLQVDVDAKLGALLMILVLLLVVQVALIVLEYLNQTIAEEAKLVGMEIMAEDLDEYERLIAQMDDVRQDVRDGVDHMAEEVRDSLREHMEEAHEAAHAYAEEVLAEREYATSAPAPVVRLPKMGAGKGKHQKDTRKRRGIVTEIFFTDLRLGFQSVIGVVVIMLLVITPSLYAWFNLSGSWDPYSKTDGLKVAVANEDTGYKGELLPLTVNVGDTIVSQLRGNSNFNWQFVSKEEAVDGINAGEYYASIVIPEDFSKDMMTYLTDDASYPEVTYYTNEKENPIAPLITQKGADSIQESIRASFTERIDEVGLTLASDLLDYLSQPRVVDYAVKMGGHLDDATSDMQEGASEMRSIADLTGITSGIVGATGSAMDGIMTAVQTCRDSLAQAESGVQDASVAFEEASSLVEDAVSRGGSGLDDVAADADTALVELEEVAGMLPGVLESAYDVVSHWEGLVSGWYDEVERLAEEAEDPDAKADLELVAARLKRMDEALARITTALSDAIDKSQSAVDEIEATRTDLKQLYADAKTGANDAKGYFREDVKGAFADLKSTLGQAADSTHVIMDGLEETMGGLSSSTGGLTGQLDGLSAQLVDSASQVDAASIRVANLKNRVNDAMNSGDMKMMSQLLLGNDTTVLATRLAAPVQKHEEAIFPVENFGSAMSSFYTVLSLWVGALVMISTMKVHLTPERMEELRKRYRLKPRHEYAGRFGIFACVSVLQSLLVSLGDLCLLHIQCVHPVLFVLECVYIGLVFCLIVYTFTELFGDIGKAVCVILLIMQVAASGGTFPVQMLAPPLSEIAVFLPFFHGMSALQGCVAGIYDGDTFFYLAFLLVYVVIMLLMGIVVRRPFRYVTDWLEAQLEKTHYM